MKRLIICQSMALAIIACLFGASLSWGVSPPKKGGMLPEIKLPVPQVPAHRDYLGVSGDGQFKIPQIKAKAVIIEILNVY